MGGDSGGPQTVTNRTELPPWLEDITKENLSLAQKVADRPYVPYTGQRISGFTPEQEQAFRLVQSGVGATEPIYGQAYGALSNVANYAPSNVLPSMVGYQGVSTGGVGPYERVSAPSVAAQDVQAQNFLQGNISGYINPYVENVESRAVEAANRTLQQEKNVIAANAARAGAFGGSRQGLAEGVATAETARNVGDLSARLRADAFNQAAALQAADQARALQASLANQQANLSAGTTTAQLAQQAQLANQAAGMRTGEFNVDRALQASLANQSAGIRTGETNVGQMLQAQLANQQAGSTGAGLRLQAASGLSNMANQYQQARQQEAALVENVGQQRQAQAQAALDEAYARFLEERNYPIEGLNLRLAATTATPYGSTQTQTKTGGPGGNSFLTGLGAVGTGASAALSIAQLVAM
jgi:hypothetical protein